MSSMKAIHPFFLPKVIPKAVPKVESVVEPELNQGTALEVCQDYCIGCHHKRVGSIAETIQAMPKDGKPFQIFLGSPQSANFNVKEKDIDAAREALKEHPAPVFVHAPQILNLSKDDAPWAIHCLKEQLRVAAAIGLRGVVVHVGKAVGQDVKVAVEIMRQNVAKVLEAATEDCPLLLETPAGQGTETLRSQEEFVGFVRSFADKRFRMCIDTCHIFACGHNPLAQIQKTLRDDDTLVKLIHYNDSATPCGSLKDHHAFVGSGHIGLKTMAKIAALCALEEIPMVIE